MENLFLATVDNAIRKFKNPLMLRNNSSVINFYAEVSKVLQKKAQKITPQNLKRIKTIALLTYIY